MTDFCHLKHNVRVSYNDILLTTLKFITVDGRPPAIVKDADFEMIHDIVKLPDKLKVVNRKKSAANSLVLKMRNIFRNNFLSLKMDRAQYNG